jgi:coenzyme F420-reducing hydrogenase beta subunit
MKPSTMKHCDTRPTDAVGLAETVIAGGYCVGCGACVVTSGSPMRLRWTSLGHYEAFESHDASAFGDHNRLQAVCPFGALAPDEDLLAAELYPQASPDAEIGRHLAAYAGHVAESQHRDRGSSGGMASWIATELLRTGAADAILHVLPRVPDTQDERLFAYGISTTPEQVAAGAKSRYYPVELSSVMRTVRSHPARYVVVGVPCFIKAVRLLARQDPLIAERVSCCIALVCGHLKSGRFAESLAWQAGVPPGDLEAIDFRHKLPDRPANQYGISVVRRGALPDQDPLVRPMRGLVGADWGMGFFKLKACDYCDDVLGELADIAVGDAWLPEYVPDPAGTNIVVVRRPDLAGLVSKAIAAGRLSMRSIGPETVAASQRGGLRHRRDGLAYRLWLQDRHGRWRPPKRVRPAAGRRRQRRVFAARIALMELSHVAYEQARRERSLEIFIERMREPMRSYEAILKMPQWKRIALPVRNWLRGFAKRGRSDNGGRRHRPGVP